MKQVKNIHELKKLSIEELVDLLSMQTSNLIQMHTEGAKAAELESCKQLLQSVQEEIIMRRGKKIGD